MTISATIVIKVKNIAHSTPSIIQNYMVYVYQKYKVTEYSIIRSEICVFNLPGW